MSALVLRPVDVIPLVAPLYPGDATPAIHHAALHQSRDRLFVCQVCERMVGWHQDEATWWCVTCQVGRFPHELRDVGSVPCPYCGG